ncbi:hypothetical protein FRB94_011283 [Tulasnella sp. JGI-2019a]|nr:hypothetical protein FRB93_004914 [Tulasnella sp. JGI-2019a]KAG8992812.1 hypothetical protein FRB94_011283 [Tulasnella sp. JGI-2019a]KAG9028436.1 hypothetical protein FRB95_006514 [Tulasnella sp. JGI-2019a]
MASTSRLLAGRCAHPRLITLAPPRTAFHPAAPFTGTGASTLLLQTRTFKFAPTDWIRNAIRSRTQYQEPEAKADRQEARKEAVEKGEGSVFDAVRQDLGASEGAAIDGRGAATKGGKLKKIHTEHKYSTGEFKISPRKLNDLSRQIAGKPVDVAILQMQFSDKRAAGRIKSTLCVARDHAMLKGIPRERMVVSQSWVNKTKAIARTEIKGRSRTGIRHHRYARLHVLLKEGETRQETLLKKRAKLIKRAVSAGVVREDVPIRNPRAGWAW